MILDLKNGSDKKNTCSIVQHFYCLYLFHQELVCVVQTSWAGHLEMLFYHQSLALHPHYHPPMHCLPQILVTSYCHISVEDFRTQSHLSAKFFPFNSVMLKGMDNVIIFKVILAIIISIFFSSSLLWRYDDHLGEPEQKSRHRALLNVKSK